jgi:hypothetical protein
VQVPLLTKKKAPLERSCCRRLFRRCGLFDRGSLGFGLFTLFIRGVQETLDQAGAAATRSPLPGAHRASRISLLSEPRHAFYSVYNGAGGKKQESRWACRRSDSSHVSVGLTGLLNPT